MTDLAKRAERYLSGPLGDLQLAKLEESERNALIVSTSDSPLVLGTLFGRFMASRTDGASLRTVFGRADAFDWIEDERRGDLERYFNERPDGEHLVILCTSEGFMFCRLSPYRRLSPGFDSKEEAR